jgi:hypothetical protein
MPTPKGSRPTPNTSTIGSRRKTEPISAIPELADDHGRSYELKSWDDLELGTKKDEASCASEEPLTGDGEGSSARGLNGFWKKGKSSENPSERTITKTSEVELRVSTVGRPTY